MIQDTGYKYMRTNNAISDIDVLMPEAWTIFSTRRKPGVCGRIKPDKSQWDGLNNTLNL
jgi:hypothetical protein